MLESSLCRKKASQFASKVLILLIIETAKAIAMIGMMRLTCPTKLSDLTPLQLVLVSAVGQTIFSTYQWRVTTTRLFLTLVQQGPSVAPIGAIP